MCSTRIHHLEQANRAVAIAQAGPRHGHPQRTVRVLAAVFAQAGRIAHDVAGMRLGMIERRREQSHEAIARRQPGATIGRFHGAPRARGIGRTAIAPPRIARGNRSALPCWRASRAASRRRRSRADTIRRPSMSVRQRATAPPARARHARRLPESFARHSRANESRTAQRNQASQTLSPRPSMPTRFIPSFQSPVPISGRPCGPRFQARSMARRQWSHSGAVGGRRLEGTNIRSCSPSASAGLRERKRLVQNGRVAGDFHVMRGHVRQPQQIVGAAGAHAHAGVGVPPVLDVAFDELARGRSQDMLARDGWRRVDEAPANPATDRGNRTRRSIGRARSGPRSGNSGPDTAASGSTANRPTAPACGPAARRAKLSHPACV